MNIIGGKLKGKKLVNCKTNAIRPAMALVRKSLFEILRNKVEDANVLDLCAGTGIVGIEALSRGAQSLTLIDSSKYSVDLILKNLKLCNLSARVVSGFLPGCLRKRIKKEKFDLIFLDPPYGQSDFIEDVLNEIIKTEILNIEGLIIIESELKSSFNLNEALEIVREKKYGNTKITILKKV